MSLPTLVNEDIVLRLSGGSGNSDPKLSRGGIESSVAVDTGNILRNLFDDIDSSGASSGITKNRLIYVHNNSTTNEMKNVLIFMLLDSESLDTTVLYGNGTAGINEDEPAIALETDNPPGVVFKASVSSSTGIQLGTIPPGGRKGVWIRLAIEPGAQPYPEDKAFFRIIVDPGIQTDIPGGPAEGPELPAYSIAIMGDLSASSNAKKNLDKIKARRPALIFLNGDLFYSDSGGPLRDIIGLDWIPKCKVSLGNHDHDEDHKQPKVLNDCKAIFSMPKEYYAFTINNMFGVVMDSELSNSTSSAQYTTLKPLLEAAAVNPGIEWIYIFNHRPVYGPASHHPANENNEIQNWHNVWDSCKVSFVISSHNHNMWRSYPMKKGASLTPFVTNNNLTEYLNPVGEIFIGQGAGGRSHHDFEGSIPSYTPWGNDSVYGYTWIDVYTVTRKSVVKFFDYNDKLLHTFTVIHGGEGRYIITAMTAQGNDGTDVPGNANDNDMGTRWTHTSNPTWLKADLGTVKGCNFVEVAWFNNGLNQVFTFEIEYSTDDVTYTTIIDDTTNTKWNQLERYTFPERINARYVRLVVKGNSVDNVASVYEFDVGVLT
ncbi:MAG TPA: discoidin domain-containing protein [Nitrososphaera sp.]|jgi:hypothetical protein